MGIGRLYWRARHFDGKNTVPSGVTQTLVTRFCADKRGTKINVGELQYRLYCARALFQTISIPICTHRCAKVALYVQYDFGRLRYDEQDKSLDV